MTVNAEDQQRIAITGLGAVSPLGRGARTLFERWRDGEVAIRDGEAVCVDFEPRDFLSKKEARRTDRFAQLALAASDEAVHDAWPDGAPAGEGVACVVATGVGGVSSLEEDIETLREHGPARVSPLGIPRLMANAASAMVAMRHGFTGESFGLVSACASGAQIIGAGARMVQWGAEAVLVGAADGRTTAFTQAAYSLMGATSQLGVSRPFDRRRDGFVPGEGAAFMVLEPYEAASARGAQIAGELLGYGASSDAHHLTAPHPEGRGAIQAMQSALEDAGVDPDQIDYVNAHGTSTPLNDRIETSALKQVLGDHAHRVPVSSLKSSVGHLQGAAGAAEVLVTLLALREQVAPPTLGLEQPEEGLDLDYVPWEAKPLPDSERTGGLIGMSNSFGFGGHNATVVIRAG